MSLRQVYKGAAGRARMLRELAVLLDAGIGMVDAMKRLSGRALRRNQSWLQDAIAEGMIDATDRPLIECSEQAGQLHILLPKLADHYEAKALRWRQFKSRMALPAFILILAFILAPLPQLAAGTLSASEVFGTLLFRVLGTAGLCWLLRHLYTRTVTTPTWLRTWYSASDWLPFIGDWQRRAEVAKAVEWWHLGYAAGMPLTDVFVRMSQILVHANIQKQICTASKIIAAGGDIDVASASITAMSPQAQQLIRTGASSGRLQDMLELAAHMERQKADDMADAFNQWMPRLIYAGVVSYAVSGLF